MCASEGGFYEYKFILPEGNYDSPQHLMDEMSSVR